MAAIDMRGSDAHFFGYEVSFASLLVAAPTMFMCSASGIRGNNLYLYGSGIAWSGGVPTAGTIDEIRIDLDGDDFAGATDINITGVNLPIVDLAQGDDLFWEAVLQNNDTVHAFHADPVAGFSTAFGDGNTFVGSVGATASNDVLDATGTPGEVHLYGDYRMVDGATLTAGHDSLLSGGAEGDVTAIGDVKFVYASAGDAVVRGGDDVIDVLSGFSRILVGDVLTVYPGATAGFDILVTGGDDTIINRGIGSIIAGEAYVLSDIVGGGILEGSATVAGGSDDITGGEIGERIAGDVYRQETGFVDGGDDIIGGGGGADDIAGDVLQDVGGTFTGGDDVIDGGLGDDTIDGQTGNDTAQFLSNALGVLVVLDGGAADGSAVGQGSDVLRDIENVIGSTQNDTVTGNGEANLVFAADGNDSLRGLGGSDTLHGWDGDDRLSGGSGADRLAGDSGNDTLAGSAGDDTLDGGANNDWADYAGAAGAVAVDLSLSASQNTGDGLDTLLSIENLVGSAFADALTGSSAANLLRGLGGLDTLTGGGGADKFDFDATTESGNTNVTADVVADFTQGSDLVDLRTIDAKPGTAGNQAFSFIGTASFSAEGQVRFSLGANGAATLVQVNTAGNGGIEMTLSFTGAHALTDLDFLL